MRVFVAYARADTEQATALVERMRAAGLTVRWDQDLDSGDWSKALRREILDADHFVWFMSDASCASVEVTKEFTVAREAGIPCHILLINAVEPERAVADARSLNWLPLTRLDDAIELCKQAPPKRRAGNGMLWLALALGILGFGTMLLASQCAAPPAGRHLALGVPRSGSVRRHERDVGRTVTLGTGSGRDR